MIESIEFMSKQEIKDRIVIKGDDKNTIVISIGDPAPLNQESKIDNAYFLPDLRETFLDVLRLEFHDIQKPVHGYVAFNDLHAHLIEEFIRHWHKVDKKVDLIVHCEAGISRSVAVSVFLADLLNLPLEGHLEFANQYVLQIMEKYFRDSRPWWG